MDLELGNQVSEYIKRVNWRKFEENLSLDQNKRQQHVRIVNEIFENLSEYRLLYHICY